MTSFMDDPVKVSVRLLFELRISLKWLYGLYHLKLQFAQVKTVDNIQSLKLHNKTKKCDEDKENIKTKLNKGRQWYATGVQN